MEDGLGEGIVLRMFLLFLRLPFFASSVSYCSSPLSIYSYWRACFRFKGLGFRVWGVGLRVFLFFSFVSSFFRLCVSDQDVTAHMKKGAPTFGGWVGESNRPSSVSVSPVFSVSSYTLFLLVLFLRLLFCLCRFLVGNVFADRVQCWVYWLDGIPHLLLCLFLLLTSLCFQKRGRGPV